tara:strand:+ start:4751 stop:6712 length:1962 start_codon:yes stop_codon:yes gene_type:complete
VTLFRQLVIAVLAALLLLYMGNLVVSFTNAKSLVERQMQIHAQDAATSIALSITQAAQGDDLATLETIVNAVSDSGFYQRIYFVDLEGNTAVERAFPVKAQNVPDWFVGVLGLPEYEGVAEVSSGWARLGQVVVVSHPGQAYQNLWQTLARQLSWFTLMGFAVCVVAFYAVRRLLAPLHDVERQANAICEQEFVQQINIPNTRELKVVVEAMNRLSARLQGLFLNQSDMIRNLRYQSHTDVVTGLSNRTDFDARLNTYARDETGAHTGLLMIFALRNLGRINELAGRSEGNDVLRFFAQTLVDGVAGYAHALIARRQGQEFAVFIPDITEDVADALAASLIVDASRVTWQQQEQEALSIVMGYSYSNEITNGPELLSEADMALHCLDVDGGQTWSKFSTEGEANAPVVSRSVLDWKKFVERAIADKAIELHVQQTVSVPEQRRVAYEVYSRFNAPGDNQLTAGTVIPMVERFGHSAAFDKLVLQSLATTAYDSADVLAVNICPGSISSASFHDWLADFLAANKELASRLVIEISEHALKIEENHIRAFERLLARTNTGLAIDHFGLESSAFGYLATLPLRYLKIHRSFIKNIHLSQENQFYVKALGQLAQTREIQVIVEGVEIEAEWQTLARMKIDAAQGYFFGHPEPLKSRA